MKNPHFKPCFAIGAILALCLFVACGSIAAPQPRNEVVIINTGDRLSLGYQVIVRPDGRIESIMVTRRGQKPLRHDDKLITSTEQRLFVDLSKAEPLDKLPTGAIPTAARTGGRRGNRGQQTGIRTNATTRPQIFVRYEGRQSPNLRTANTAEGRVLYQDVKQILQVLRLPIPNAP